METHFTKGLWQQSHRKIKGGMYSTQVYDDKGEEICTLAWHRVKEPKGVTSTDREPNARLIATAPEMYQMLDGINTAIMDCKNEIELADAITSLSHDIDQVLTKAVCG